MHETTKTILFVAIALLSAVTAWAVRPRSYFADPLEIRGQQLFPHFEGVRAADRLEIVTFDEAAASPVRRFVVARQNGLWSIPSHHYYPADAERQLGDIAATLADLTILDVAGDAVGDHGEFGVLDPDSDAVTAGARGVGRRVQVADARGRDLAAMIVGREVPDRPNQRYVRRPGENLVFVVELDIRSLSSRFEDWIEEDLLQLNPFDIRRVRIRDYRIDQLRGALNERHDITLGYDDQAEPRWTLETFREAVDAGWRDLSMPEGQELDVDRLNELRNNLDNLRIVDVARKPGGLSADLQAGEQLAADEETLQSLAARGFLMGQTAPGQFELFSVEGDIQVTMRDGVEYILRFGDIATGAASAREEDDESPTGHNRYIMVTTRFNEAIIPQPALQALPEAPPEDAEAAEEPANPEEEAGQEGDEAAADEEERAPTPTAEELAAERERIERENQRRRDEYEETLAAGRERVEQLNARFADWYYVIPNDVFEKIHLSRDAIFRVEEADDEAPEEAGEDWEFFDPVPGEDYDLEAEPREASPLEGLLPEDFDHLKQDLDTLTPEDELDILAPEEELGAPEEEIGTLAPEEEAEVAEP